MKTTSKTSNSSKLQNFYKVLKAKASEKYFTKSVGVFANSSNYPNTVSLTLQDLMKDILVLVRYTDTESSKAYAIPAKDLMPILDTWHKQGNKLICDSRSVDVNEVGNLIRVPFDAIPVSYQI